MTFIHAIFEFLWNSDIARLIGGALAALLAFWGYGAAKSRQGRVAAQKQAEIDKAKDYIATREKLDNVEAVTDPSDARKRLHERNAGKP